MLSWGKPKRHSRTSQCEFQIIRQQFFRFQFQFSAVWVVFNEYIIRMRAPLRMRTTCARVLRVPPRALREACPRAITRYNPL